MGVRRDVTRLQVSRSRSCARPPRVGHTRPTQLVLTTSRVGHPKVCGVFSSYRVGPGCSGRGCSEYPNSGLRSGFLFVPSRTRVKNLRRISSPSVSDGTRVLMRKNVQSNHRTYSVNEWIKVGRECRNCPGNCSSEVLRTGRTFAGRENQLSSISRHCSGVLPCCRQFDHRTWGWFGGFVTVGVLVVVRGVPAVGGASVIPASARGSGKVIPSELVHVVPSQDPPLAVISLTRLIAAGPAHSSVQPYVPSVNAVFGPGEVQ